MNIGKIFKVLFQNDLKNIITAIFSQGMLSISNFVIGIIMAKYTTKNEYGMYVMLFSFIGILGGYQNGLINAPLMSLVNKKIDSEKNIYIHSLSVGKDLIFIPILLIMSLSFIGFGYFNNTPGYYVSEAFVLFFVTLIFLIKEYYRTLNYVVMNTTAIFKMDMVNVIVVFLGMGILVYYEIVLSLTGIMVLGFGYFSAFLFSSNRKTFKSHINRATIKATLLENWNYGKWVILGVTSSLAKDRGYIYIVSAILGLSTLAEISATRLFLMPIGLLSLSSGQIVIAKGSKLLATDNEKEFRDFIFSFLSILLIVSGLYFVFIVFTTKYIIGILGEKYFNLNGMIYIWGVYFLIYAIRMLIGTALIVYGEFKKQGAYDLVGSIFTLIFCIVLVFTNGRFGAIISLIIGEIVVMACYIKLYRNKKNTLNNKECLSTV